MKMLIYIKDFIERHLTDMPLSISLCCFLSMMLVYPRNVSKLCQFEKTFLKKFVNCFRFL